METVSWTSTSDYHFFKNLKAKKCDKLHFQVPNSPCIVDPKMLDPKMSNRTNMSKLAGAHGLIQSFIVFAHNSAILCSNLMWNHETNGNGYK